jgi:hypothetical protein
MLGSHGQIEAADSADIRWCRVARLASYGTPLAMEMSLCRDEAIIGTIVPRRSVPDEIRRCRPLMAFGPTINLDNGQEPHFTTAWQICCAIMEQTYAAICFKAEGWRGEHDG